ncbi:MAG: DUF4252 domain-containing protein [Blastocatellia bacterium]|nr:DUF4252 domain-containing protein [Blastocatellia bacterium]
MFDSAAKRDVETDERFLKSFAIIAMRLLGPLLVLTILATASAYAQDAKLKLDHLDKLAEKADQSIDINLDGVTLSLAEKALSSTRSPEEAVIKELVKQLKGIYVKRFEFEQEGQYAEADIAPLREQLSAPAWSRIVGVRSKRKGENIEVYAMAEGEKMIGLAVIAIEPKELTIVHIVGPVDLEKLIEVARYFGMPGLEFEKPKNRERGKEP